MIEIKNISHSYCAKDIQTVKALQDVSYNFADTGMYFIRGKSGSGKSTLLNLLGGIDKIQEGDIIVDGMSIKNFASVNYDGYRSRYSGVIFQEFNLIDELNIYDNIYIQLSLADVSNNDIATNISNSLERVGLSGYEKRYPGELSGGEKQRVAIARQLAKGAKLILADEPTGNLDTDNAINIFNLLKDLSKNILVIVVSHDIESANMYADFIINIADGKILDQQQSTLDASSATNITEFKKNVTAFNKTVLSNKLATKLALKNANNRKVRFSIAIILLALSITMICLFLSHITYNPEQSLANAYKTNDVKFANIIKGEITEYDGWTDLILNDRGNIIPHAALYDFETHASERHIKEIAMDSRFKIGGGKYYSNNLAEITDASDITSVLGYEMYPGYLPLSDTSAYITDFFALGILAGTEDSNYYYIENGQVYEIPDSFEIADLIGKTVVLNSNLENKLTISGIIKTDYERFTYPNYSSIYGEIAFDDEMSYSERKEYQRAVYNALYVTKAYLKNLAISKNEIVVPESISFCLNGQNILASRVSKSGKIIGDSNGQNVVLTSDYAIYNDYYISLNQNEIVLSLKEYNNIFKEDKLNVDYITYKDSHVFSVKNYPTHVGETLQFEIIDSITGRVIDVKEYKLAGLLIKGVSNYTSEVYLDENAFTSLSNAVVGLECSNILLGTSIEEQDIANILTLFRKYDVVASSPYTLNIYELGLNFYKFQLLFIIFGDILFIISLILFMNFISVTIIDKKKDIGIIRAIGGSSMSVFKIFFIEGVLFALLTSVSSMALYETMRFVFNNVYGVGILKGITVLRFYPLSMLYIPLMSFIAMLISSIIPLMKMNRQSPVKIIRDI
ncbi:MAG: ATP-binding cassette domain-containing protein [Christensenellaceae bacterium]|jgi:ABC-type lipoprotein export system ATPase subunit|nr:ATP-binding cassette domain-containing protein [Christensenellaceae bacterium]